jgi:phosphinothricin acetyltransferase
MIRAAGPGDAEALRSIWNHVIRTSTATFTTVEKTPEDIGRLLADRPVLVLEGGRGFATYGPFRSGPGYAHVAELTILLAPEATGQGFGAALLGALEEHARGQGLRVLVAAICAENAAALALHRKCGFEKTAYMPGLGRKFGRDLDLVLMQKNLPPAD